MNVKKIKHREPSEATKKQILAASVGIVSTVGMCQSLNCELDFSLFTIQALTSSDCSYLAFQLTSKIRGFSSVLPFGLHLTVFPRYRLLLER